MRKFFATSVVAAVTVSSTLVVSPIPASAAEPLPAGLVDQLKAAGTELIDVGMLDQLGDTIPGLGTNPANLLGLHEPFQALSGLLAAATDEALATAIDNLDGDGYTFSNVIVSVGNPVTTVSFDVAAARSVQVPLLVSTEEVQVAGAEMTASVSMPATNFQFEFDTSVGGPADAFAIVSPPTLTVGATLDAAVSEQVQFGFADATAAGTAKLDTAVSLALVDPDGSGRLTGQELADLDVADVTTLSFPAAAPDDVDIDLTLTATVAGTSFGGTLSVSDANLFGDPEASITVTPSGTNPIDLLANITPETAITSLTQLVSSIGAAMTGGDLKLPFLGDGVFIPGDLGVGDAADFDRVYDAIRPILDYVEPRAAGQIVCGTLVTAPDDPAVDGIPAGSVRDLEVGDTVYCRAFTAADATTVTWNVAGATTATDAGTDSVGTAPTRNMVFTMTAAGELDVSVDYTNPDGDSVTVEQRADTIQELLVELAAAGLIPTPDSATYNASLESFEFPVATTVAGPISRSVTVDAGSSLVAQSGLTGLAAAEGGAGATVEVSGIEAAITLGLIVTEDEADINPADNVDVPPGPGDRFYVKTPDPIISVDEVAISGNLSMVGRLGFLEVAAEASGSLGKPDAASPALAVSLAAPEGITVGGTSDASATLVRDLLSGLGLGSFTPSVNLQFDGSIGVTSSVPGASLTGSIDVLWDLDNPAHPVLTPDLDFQQNLFPFSGDETLEHDGGPAADETLFTSASPGLLSNPGLVGAQLVDPATNATCTITSIISDTTLRCENPEPDDGDPDTPVDQNPIVFADGVNYEVAGNTLAYLADILDAIERLAAYLEDAIGDDAFTEPLPLVGVTPAELVDQVGELRRMVDEFRGVQDAQITCTLAGDAGADIRAVPIAAAGGTATLDCHAASGSTGVSDVRWRVNGDAQNGTWVDAPAGTVGPGPDTVALTVTAPASDHDGYVSLGSEYTIEVQWTESGESKSSALPPRTPRSLQHLADLITETLDLPDNVLEFDLVDAASPNRALRINLGYGICSDPAPSTGGGADPCAGLPTTPAPSANLQFDLGASLPALVGLETTGTIDVRFAALGQFDIGIPLNGDTPVLYGTTGLEARVEVNGTDLGVTASIGPVNASLGPDAGGFTGTVTADSNTVLTDDTKDFTLAGSKVPVGAIVTKTSTGDECVVSSVAATELGCAIDWTVGDAYEIGGITELKAALALELQVAESGTPLADADSVAIDAAEIDVTDLDTFLAGDADCGDMPAGSAEALDDGDGDDDRSLEGIACGRFSLELGIGSAAIYLGELGIDLDGGGLSVYAPSDLAAQLEAALLDPAFLIRALPGLLQVVEDGLRDAADSGAPAPIADPLRVGADGIGEIRVGVETIIDQFGAALDGITNLTTLATTVDTELTNLIQGLVGPDLTVTVEVQTDCGTGFGNCDPDTQSLVDLVDIQALVTVGQEVTAGTGINLGLEGLPFSIEGGVEAYAEWSVTAGIGVSRDDGPYLALDPDDPEVGVSAGVRLLEQDPPPDACTGPIAESAADTATWEPKRCLSGRLAFLFVTAVDNDDVPSKIEADLGFDITGDGDRITLFNFSSLGIDFTLEGEVHLDLAIRTGIGDGSPDFPSVLGRFMLDWTVAVGDPVTAPTVSFGDLHLDLGTFLTGFLDPIVKEVKKITGPLQPIIDVLMAPIPVVSDLAELVGSDPITMISLLEAASGADLSLVKAVAAFITFVNAVGTIDGSLQIPLGGIVNGLSETGRTPGAFNVNAAAASAPVSPTEAGKLIDTGTGYEGGSGFTSDIAGQSGGKLPDTTQTDGRPSTFGVPGLSFPFLEDASQIFGILVGRDATLIRWDAGTLKASAGFSYDFGPIMVGPVPITITIGGEVGVKGRFAIGYDTSGIRQLLDGGSGVALFDGIFIDDLDSNGNDVPEITFFGKVFAGASVDLVIISAGVRGGIELTFSLDLDDRPDPDGKLRILEIVDKLQNPICLFVVSGKIEAFLEAFVKIDLFFFTEEFSFELVRITLLEWSSACEPPTPNLADDNGDGVLYLNVGSRTTNPGRNIAEDQIDDKIEVRQLGPGKVRVSGYGWEEVHENVGLIVADGGAGADELLFLPGTLEGEDGSGKDDDIPFTIPIVVSGGPGDDIIKTGEAEDKIFGDAAIAAGSWAGKNYAAIADQAPDADDGANADSVNAGPGDDLVYAGPGNDQIEGEFGADTILGEGGEDSLKGGPGPDSIDGGADGDTIQGGPVKQPKTGDPVDDDDAIAGGGGRDVVAGDFGDDVIFGDEAFAGFFVDDGTGRLVAGPPSVTTWRNDWCPADGGGSPGDDILTGTDGDDVITGGGGNDKIDAGVGADFACGGPGNDEVLGDVGDDELRGDAGDDVLTGADGDDLIYGGTENDSATGGNGDDDMFGDDGSDLLYGDAGDDVVVGDGGAVADRSIDGVANGSAIDPAKVGAVDDNTTRASTSSGDRRDGCAPAQAEGHSDCVWGGSGSDALFGGSDGDFLFGETGVDLLEGNDGPDELRGGTEADLLLGSAGSDDIFGDSGDDQAMGDRTIDQWALDTPSAGDPDDINGGPGADRLEGDGGSDTILGGADGDHIEGNSDADTAFGEGGDDDVIGGSDTSGVADTGDMILSGGLGQDVIAGDNAVVLRDGGYVLGRSVTLLDLAIGGGDLIEGDADTDAAFGQAGNDTMSGDQGGMPPVLGVGAPDYLEGGDGQDTIEGEAGGDDIVGGGSSVDGIIDADREGTGLADEGELVLDGGPGRDWIAGDNARMDRVLGNGEDYPSDLVTPIVLFDLAKAGAPAAAGSFGGDVVTGGDDTDLIFGQGGDDTLDGDGSPDYVEGNDGDDTISGGDGDDDLVGGGSANDGVIDKARVGETLHDGGESQVSGNAGVDWIAGDNAFMNRVLFPADPSPIDLFDVNSADVNVSGGDNINGDDGDDLIFGQGNGAQAGQSDPGDGVDNDGDGVIDEDGAGWLGDRLFGDAGEDYIEGNHGADLIRGGTENDDLIGGGSAIDGVIDPDREGNGLFDDRDTIHGDGGDDVAAGDNTRILPAASGSLWLTDARAVVLFDVNSLDAALSGGDFVSGGDGDDVMFGQGNGAQPATQADPLDGYDNDLDGRESGDSLEYDCEDLADNDGAGDVDGLDPDCVMSIDEDSPWQGDLLLGGNGVDYGEGNHGADWIFGGDGQDDLVGGGSAIDGVIDADRSGVGLHDAADVVHGDGDHDVITGDNATLNKVPVGGAWSLIANGAGSAFPILQRQVSMAMTPELAGNFGDDHLLGDDGHDQLYGQQGGDLIEGNAGDDGVIGDLGRFVTSVETGNRAARIQPKVPFIKDDVFAAGTLTHLTTLFAQQTGQGAEGDDIILGGQGHDDLHGGPGNDIVNGDRYAPPSATDEDLLLQNATPGQFVWDDPDNPASVLPWADEDALFGGDGDDVMWGGRGPDHLYGGHGNDSLDVRPRPATAVTGQDPPSWYTWTRLPGAEPEHYQDSDTIYGGWGADVMQANLAGNGPQNGDRLFDWVGAYNLYYICASTYGDWVATRAIEPGLLAYFENLASGDGLENTATPGSSGYRELALVYTKDVKNNANPPHPETPGHFYCGDGYTP